MDSSKNAKSELVMFLQRFLGRSMTKEDLVYKVEEVGDQFQATVRLACHNNEEHVGEISATDKEAMQSAAQIALDCFAPEIAAMPPPTKSKRQRGKDRPEGQLMGEGRTDGRADGEPTNFKSVLVQTLQDHCRRAMTKADVIYSSIKVGDLYQSTVTLQCLQGMAYVGEPAPIEKKAEQAAAEQAMSGQEQWLPCVDAPPAPVARGTKRGRGGPGMPAQSPKAPDVVNPKSELVIFLQGHIKRTLQKMDMVFTHVTGQMKGGTLTQATVTLNCLEGQAFAGEPCPTLKLAEASAAAEALKAFAPHLHRVKVFSKNFGANQTPLGRPLGGHMAKRQALGPSFTGVLPPRGGVAPSVKPPVMFQVRPGVPTRSNPPRAGRGGGGGRPASASRTAPPTGPRTMIVEAPVLGEVIEWNDGQNKGTIRPHTPISHPMAQDSKLYVHSEDISNAMTLPVGSLVQFRVYQDAKGLGASDVMLF